MQDIDRALIERVMAEDRDAFRVLYDRSSSMVYTVARKIIGIEEDAREVVQDVYVKVHQEIKRFRFESSFKTWIYRITVNMALNRAKKLRGRRDVVPFEEYMDVPQEGNAPDAGIQQADAQRRVQKWLGALSEDFRACIVLREIEGLSYDEIAEALGVNINTVRTRLMRARLQLAEIVKEGGADAV